MTGDLTAALRAADKGEEDYAAPTVPAAALAELIGLAAAKTISHGSAAKS